MMQPLWKTASLLTVPQNVKHEVTIRLCMSTPRCILIHPREIKTHVNKRTDIQLFIATWFIIMRSLYSAKTHQLANG